MIAYHVDRSMLLSAGQTLSTLGNYNLEKIFDIYGNSFSEHGIHYITKNFTDDIHSFLWEISTEYIRLLKYPQYPSRFKCLFATEDLEQAKLWKNLFQSSKYQILKIECSKYYKFDANWITKPGAFYNFYQTDKFDNISFASYCYFADKYWSGQPSPTPLWELLVELPCKCLEIVDD